jgi:GNAT superfamily N-acetyltransferase
MILMTDMEHDTMTITITRERPDTPDAMALIAELEAQLAPLYPPENRFGLSVERLIAEDVAFFVLRADGAPAACGGVKLVAPEYGEVKRMFVRPQYRGQGLARRVLDHLAEHTRTNGIPLLRLETGIHQHEAIRLYERAGFSRIPPFGPYADSPTSVCFEKRIGV